MAQSDTGVVLVLTTWPADRDVEAVGRTLVEERLAACISVLPPMSSTYRWQGQIESASERQLLVKTSRTRVNDLRARLLALHPYEMPELLVIPVAAGAEAYLAWVLANTRAEGGPG